MVIRCKVILDSIGRVLLLTVLAFFIFANSSFAAPSAPTMGETDWRTGELEIAWSNVTPGNTIIVYAKTFRQPDYEAMDAWIANTATGSYIVKPFENGQTVWHYIVQVDPITGQMSPPSNVGKQTPPITAFIINWPDMFKELSDLLKDLNDKLTDKLESLATPSQQAQDDLNAAVNNVKDALGVGSAQGAGDALTGGFNGMQPGMSQPGVDDGNGTFTGGNTGPNLPFPSVGNGDPNMSLITPDLDSGTDTELTMRIPIGIKKDGSLWYIKIFTKEQMEKIKWIFLFRTIAAAIIYIMFGLYIVYRFAPQLKS